MLTKRLTHSRPTTHSVRIIGGSLRGSKLPVPDLPGLRPTPDRVRETLFNWLRPVLPGARVLDLFAGTGVLGIEALSHGASSVEFVEMQVTAAQSLREQLQRLKIDAHAQVHNASALHTLDRIHGEFDVILLDPPYALDLWSKCLELIVQRQRLSLHGCLYLEWPDPGVIVLPAGLQWHKQGRAGAVSYGLLKRCPDSG